MPFQPAVEAGDQTQIPLGVEAAGGYRGIKPEATVHQQYKCACAAGEGETGLPLSSGFQPCLIPLNE